MFHSARITLTAWYVLIALIITVLFSLLAYNGFRFEFEQGLQRQRVFFQQSFQGPNNQPITIFRRTDPDIAHDLRMHLIYRIFYIDTAVIIAAALGGYLLAGRTLKPIQEMVDEQNRFITDASHELRTPITALRSELEATLLSKKLTEKESRAVLISNLEEVISLQNLSDNLLELATAQRTRRTIVLREIILLDVLESAIKKVAPLAKNKQIVIENNVKNMPILGQSDRLVELFILIIDNAVKYSPKKTKITINSLIKDKSIYIAVKDTGIGIMDADQEKIFQRFYRSDKSRTSSKSKGYGLGLAIAKQIVEEHKGMIQVKSEVNKGSVFTVILPLK